MSTRRFERVEKLVKFMGLSILAALAPLAFAAGQADIAKWDPRMAADKAVVDTNGVKWIDGLYLPIEGRWNIGDTKHYYIASGSKVETPSSWASGVTKPVVFYGTSITHGGCCTRPGLGFVNIVGRELQVPVYGLGFSGSGVMEYELSDVISRIDASCYVLDCLANIGSKVGSSRPGRNVEDNYEPFIRNLRAKRPGVPIVMAEQCDVYCKGKSAKDRYARALYEKLIAEGWEDLVYLPKEGMFTGDYEGTVDGCHPNDLGMMSMSKAFGKAVREALGL